jgi:hypothetical protein
VILQKYIRRFVQRCHIHRIICSKFEKIYDPKRKRFYYYNIDADTSSWKKPPMLLYSDIFDVSPSYTPDHAAIIIQRSLWRRAALRRV